MLVYVILMKAKVVEKNIERGTSEQLKIVSSYRICVETFIKGNMIKKLFVLGICFVFVGSLSAQTSKVPDLPILKGYKGLEGSITKYNSFNYLTLRDKPGDNSRKSTGQYWEVNYVYDSAFRQKQKFGEFMEAQIKEKGGTLFFQDTSSIHFALPDDNGNLWGKVMLSSNSSYKIKMIKERAFINTVIFDSEQVLEYDDFVEPVEIPPRIGFMPNSVATRAEQSKFNHYTFTYTTDDQKTFRQSLMGPYWDYKIEVQDEDGEVDKRISYIEILESYYRAVMKAGGNIVKNRAREIIFNLPDDDYTLWVRVMVTMDGVYFIKVIKQLPGDFQEPERLFAQQLKDSLPSQDK